jgi:hypothetical protein
MQAFYSGEILGVFTLVAAKGSLLVPLTSIPTNAMHQRLMLATGAITLLWGLSAVLLIAFQCPPPSRWEVTDPRCINFVSAHISFTLCQEQLLTRGSALSAHTTRL